MGLVRIAGYPMDLAISEGHSFPGESTKFPVEVGADVSDHIRDLPPEITLECLVSDLVPGQVAGDPARGQTVETPDGEIQFVLPSEEALAVLRELKALRKPVTIETSLGKFESMAFVNLDVPRDKDKNNALFFTAKFHKFNQVTNKRTKVRVRSSMAGAGGQSKVKTLTATGIQILKTIRWFHGDPPGTPFHEGNIVELVNVGYIKPAGVPNNQLPGLIDSQLRYEEIGYDTGAVKFFDTNGEQIVGDRLQALRLDLRRDRDGIKSGPFAPEQAIGPDGPVGPGRVIPRPKKSLPPSLDISKWSLPSGFSVP